MADTFEKIRRGNCTLFINNNFRNADLEKALFEDPQKLGNLYKLTTAASSKFSKVYKFTANFQNVPRNCFIKEYLCRSWWDFIKHIFKPGRAIRDFNAAIMLNKYGFNPPEVIALLLCKKGFLTAKSFLVTVAIDNAKPLFKWVIEKQRLSDRRLLAKTLGKTIGKMHNLGIFHGDLRMGNVLAKKEQDEWKIYLLDNERTKKFKRLPERLRIKNLVQINMLDPLNTLSRTDRMRFFKYYLQENKEIIGSKRDLAEQVMAKTNQRMEKIIQRTKASI